jgi:hypothetical protein
VVYAFREDAVRADAIQRPTTTNLSGSTCNAAQTDLTTWLSNWTTLITASSASTLTSTTALTPYFIDAVGNLLGQTGSSQIPQDPPINPCTKLSPKPVDFYADPDRRPHGFTLLNGLDLRRKASSSTWDTDGRGLSFISDNPVYIWGHFNAHTAATNTTTADLTNNPIEEFTDYKILTGSSPSWTNFYNRTALDTRFARANTDSWRTSSIVTDALTVLSGGNPYNSSTGGFVPGYIDRGILWNDSDTTNFTDNSYGGMHILRNETGTTPTTSPSCTGSAIEWGPCKSWWRTDDSTPIKISRRGLPIYSNSGTPTEYGFATGEYWENPGASTNGARNRINVPSNTSVYAILVSGIVPSRNTQDGGGLINFTRVIENWSGKTLTIIGSLVQLNFSTYTGIFDQDSWEPRTLVSGEQLNYYYPPNRNFGFDVGLLYAPPDPVARRFSTLNNLRSEFYRELPVNDPYTLALRCAYKVASDGTVQKTQANQVDPTATTTDCGR